MSTRTSRPSQPALRGKCLSGPNLAIFLRRPEFEPGVGTAWFLKPISLRVRTWCRYSLALKPISLEQTVRMTHEGFTSFASGASWKAPLGSEPRIFFLARARVRFLCERREFLCSMWTGWRFLWVKDLYVYPPTHIQHKYAHHAPHPASTCADFPQLHDYLPVLDSPSGFSVGVGGLFS